MSSSKNQGDNNSTSTPSKIAGTVPTGTAGNWGAEYTKHITGTGSAQDPWIFEDPSNGSTYMWDTQNNKWNQVTQQYLMAFQQSAYGKEEPVTKESKKAKKRQLALEKALLNVYVTGLPPDITKSEIVQHFSKCGLLKKDPETAEPIVKLYSNEDGTFKGDCLICYFRPESVDLAIKILDQTEITPGFKITVQQAKFEHKDGQPKPKKKKKAKGVKLYDQSKELGWEEREDTHVIVKHLFSQDEAWEDAKFFPDLEEELMQELEKIGEAKVKIFKRNPEGVVAIKFENHDDAAKCIRVMNGRWFGGKQLDVDFYDGWSNYEVTETEEQKEERMSKFSQWIEQDEEGQNENT